MKIIIFPAISPIGVGLVMMGIVMKLCGGMFSLVCFCFHKGDRRIWLIKYWRLLETKKRGSEIPDHALGYLYLCSYFTVTR